MMVDDEWYIPMSFIDCNCILLLKNCIDSKCFEEIGQLCVRANKTANYKYGENKAKLMEQIGVVTIDTNVCPHKVKTTILGEDLLSLDVKDSTSIMIRLSVGIPVIHHLLSNVDNNQVGLLSVFPSSFKPSTIKRRSSSIVHIIRDIESEYNCKGFVSCLPSGTCFQPIERVNRKLVNDGVSLLMKVNDRTNDTCHSMVKMNSKIDTCQSELKTELELKTTSWSDMKDLNQESRPLSETIGDNGEFERVIIRDNEALMEHDSNYDCNILLDGHELIKAINSFVNDFYNIDDKSIIKPLLESLTNIIEDPSSDYITQTLAYLPLGYFVKTAKLTKESLNENECACFIALLKIYNLDMNLVVYNLSGGFTLKDFYDLRETYNLRYGILIDSVVKSMGIDEFFKRAFEESADKYKSELEQLHKSESNLYYRLKTEGTLFLDEDSYMRALQLISQSRLEYPINGIDICYVPQLSDGCQLRTNSSEESLLGCISSVYGSDGPYLSRIWNTSYTSWQDRVNELLMMAYALSPHKIVMKGDVDILYAISQAIIDKCQLFGEIGPFIDNLYDRIIAPIEYEDQIRILNRVNSIFISNYLEQDLIPILVHIQDDIHWITRICMDADRNAGRNAKYKSRMGIGSSLDVYEKSEVEKIIQSRLYTDTKRSRQNRYRNKIRYDYNEE